jgi:integrase
MASPCPRLRDSTSYQQPSTIRGEAHLHDLRHWSATHAIAAGHNVRSVAARLGHADPTPTMRTYAHALDGLDGAIADTLAGVLDGKLAEQ